MLTASPIFGPGIKMIGLTAIAAILLSTSLSLGIPSTYAQFGVQQEQEPQGAGEQQVQSDGGLTATLNGDSFRRGDTIIIGGTVAEREGGSTVYARIYDPDSIEIDFRSIRVNTDGTFRQGFIAGEDSLNDGTSDPMTKSGTYTIALEYSPPDNADIETTELTFGYDAGAPPAVVGQNDSATTAGGEGQTTTFQNLTEGFRIQVPDGWVTDDQDVADYLRESFVETNGYDVFGFICPQENALPVIGGLYDCASVGGDGIGIYAYPNLNTRPEFAPIINQNRNITIDDIIAYDIQIMRNILANQQTASGISIEGQMDTTVNVVDPTTNQTVQTLPAREVVYGIPAMFGDTVFVTYSLIILANSGNDGYSIRSFTGEGIELDDGMPSFVRQAFDSFELLPLSSRPNVTNSLSSPQEQSQQQLEQSSGGLTARLNANNFTTGDTITVNGTVAERGPNAFVFVEVINPQGETAQSGQVRVTADNTFTYSFVADEQVTYGRPMVTSGNYLMSVQFGVDEVEFTFYFDANSNVTTVTTTSEGTAASTTQSPQTPSQPQQQLQNPQLEQQQPLQEGASVSIVPGSSSLTTDAYAPNPVQVSVGDTVTWTNDDSLPHTVTSGENATPNGEFDSGIMSPGATFEHTFTEAGQYPYFCLLHPNQVGTVSVS